ncbi:NADH-quinone oxidoreductase subunit NuoN [Mariniluteicoccus endophyticus]
MNSDTFQVPVLEYAQLAPLFVVFGMACLQVGVEAFLPRRGRAGIQIGLSAFGIVAALALTVINWLTAPVMIGAMGSIALDAPTYFLWSMLLVLTLVSLLVFGERRLGGGNTAFTPQAASVPGTPAEKEAILNRLEHTEIYPLLMFALTGMMIFPASNDLLTMFIALEVLSLPLYLMCGLARRRRLLSQEASLKYFLLGALSSAFFLYGAALLYGYAGDFTMSAIDTASRNGTGSPMLLLGGLGLVAVGLLFKVGAVPFHSWTPDVYQGAPTPVTGFMAACTKIAAVGALLRVFYVALGGARWDWQPLMAAVAVATMVVGSLLAITQTDVKRMLAYSSIAHAGFILTAVTGAAQGATGVPAGQLTSLSAIMFYLATYGLTTVGAFAIVTMVRDAGGEVTSLKSWSGLGRKNPGIAAVFALFLLSFAGIPLTSGFIGKWAVFAAAWRGGFAWLVVVAVLCSLVAAFFYLRVIMVMFFSDPSGDARVVAPSWMTWIAVAVGCVATLGLGILPGPLMDVATRASEFIR